KQHVFAPVRHRADHIQRVFVMDRVAGEADGSFAGIAVVGHPVHHRHAAVPAMFDGAAQHYPNVKVKRGRPRTSRVARKQLAQRTAGLNRRDFQATRTRNSPSPVTPPTSVSPATTAATPSGVPVKIRSPGCSSHAAERCSMISPRLQISLETLLRWR